MNSLFKSMSKQDEAINFVLHFMCSVFRLLIMNHFAFKHPLYQFIKTAVQTFREILPVKKMKQ